MSRWFHIVLLIFVFILFGIFIKDPLLFSQNRSSQQERPLRKQIGIVLFAFGDVKIIDSENNLRNGRSGTPLFIGDKIQTGKRSRFQANLIDGSTVRLDAYSDIRIDDYYFNEEEGKAKSEYSVENGKIGFVAGQISKMAPQNYKIETATAVIGIRGSAGNFITSDGTIQKVPDDAPYLSTEPGMAIAPSEGHALTIEVPTGEVIVLDNPDMALVVSADGSTSMVPVEEVGLDEASQESEEEGAEEEESEEEAEEESQEETEDNSEEETEEGGADESEAEESEPESEEEPTTEAEEENAEAEPTTEAEESSIDTEEEGPIVEEGDNAAIPIDDGGGEGPEPGGAVALELDEGAPDVLEAPDTNVEVEAPTVDVDVESLSQFTTEVTSSVNEQVQNEVDEEANAVQGVSKEEADALLLLNSDLQSQIESNVVTLSEISPFISKKDIDSQMTLDILLEGHEAVTAELKLATPEVDILDEDSLLAIDRESFLKLEKSLLELESQLSFLEGQIDVLKSDTKAFTITSLLSSNATLQSQISSASEVLLTMSSFISESDTESLVSLSSLIEETDHLTGTLDNFSGGATLDEEFLSDFDHDSLIELESIFSEFESDIVLFEQQLKALELDAKAFIVGAVIDTNSAMGSHLSDITEALSVFPSLISSDDTESLTSLAFLVENNDGLAIDLEHLVQEMTFDEAFLLTLSPEVLLELENEFYALESEVSFLEGQLAILGNDARAFTVEGLIVLNAAVQSQASTLNQSFSSFSSLISTEDTTSLSAFDTLLNQDSSVIAALDAITEGATFDALFLEGLEQSSLIGMESVFADIGGDIASIQTQLDALYEAVNTFVINFIITSNQLLQSGIESSTTDLSTLSSQVHPQDTAAQLVLESTLTDKDALVAALNAIIGSETFDEDFLSSLDQASLLLIEAAFLDLEDDLAFIQSTLSSLQTAIADFDPPPPLEIALEDVIIDNTLSGVNTEDPFTNFIDAYKAFTVDLGTGGSTMTNVVNSLNQGDTDFTNTDSSVSSLSTTEQTLYSDVNTLLDSLRADASTFQNDYGTLDQSLTAVLTAIANNDIQGINDNYASTPAAMLSVTSYKTDLQDFLSQLAVIEQDFLSLYALISGNAVFNTSFKDQVAFVVQTITDLEAMEAPVRQRYLENVALSIDVTPFYATTLASDESAAPSVNIVDVIPDVNAVVATEDIPNVSPKSIVEGMPPPEDGPMGFGAFLKNISEAVDFDGIDDSVELSNSASLSFGSEFTLEAIVKFDAPLSSKNTIISKWIDSSDNAFIFDYENGILSLWVFNGYENMAIRSSGSLPLEDGSDHHVAAIWDSGVMALLIDGQVISSTTSTSAGTFTTVKDAPNASVVVGGRANANSFELMDGRISEIRIWNYARTTTQIAANMNMVLGSADESVQGSPGLITYLRPHVSFGEFDGSLHDFSDNDHDGVLLGFLDSAFSFDEMNEIYNSSLFIGGSPNPVFIDPGFILSEINAQVANVESLAPDPDVVSANYSGMLSGVVIQDSFPLNNLALTLNFTDPMLKSRNMWHNFGTVNPVLTDTTAGSALGLAVYETPPTEFLDKETIYLRNYGAFGPLDNINIEYAFKVDGGVRSISDSFDDALAPKIGISFSVPAENAVGGFKRYMLVSGPLPGEHIVDTYDIVTNSISLTSGKMWIVDITDSTSPKVLVSKYHSGDGVVTGVFVDMDELIRKRHYNLEQIVVSHTIADWLNLSEVNIDELANFDTMTFGEALYSASVQSVEVFYNLDEIAQYSDGSQDVSTDVNAALVDYVKVTDGGGFPILNENWDVNTPLISSGATYVDKQNFYIPDASSVLPMLPINLPYGFPMGLPGVVTSSNMVTVSPSVAGQTFNHINWGVWGATLDDQGTTKNAFGYFATGDLNNATRLVDRDSYVNNIGPQVRSYTGGAIGSILGLDRTGQMVIGTATLNVNFASGQVSGGIAFPQDTIDFTNLGRIDELHSLARDGLIFGGPTIMNGANFIGGTYTGQFFGVDPGNDINSIAKEAAGTFNANDGVRAAIGAFGVQGANMSLP